MPTGKRSHRQQLRTSLEELDALEDAQSAAIEALENAEDVEFVGNDRRKFGRTVGSALEAIRDAADALAFRILNKEIGHGSIASECERVVRDYLALISTSQGQVYRKALFEYDNAGLDVIRQTVQLEHDREKSENANPNLNVQDLWYGMTPATFWDKLGQSCHDLLNPKHRLGEHFDQIYGHLAQLDQVHSSKAGLYVGLLQAYETMNAYDMNYRTHKPMSVSHEYLNGLFALTVAGNTLCQQCLSIKGIIASQPRQTVKDKSEPVYRHVGEYFLANDQSNLRITNKYHRAMVSVITRFGTLFDYDSAAVEVLTIHPPGVRHRRSGIYAQGGPSSS